jgi:hypothetical protein
MTDEQKAAAERLRAAIAGKTGKPKRSFAEVAAADVVTVGGLIADDKHTEVTAALVMGATGALGGKSDPDGELKVHQYADQVAKLLEAAGV